MAICWEGFKSRIASGSGIANLPAELKNQFAKYLEGGSGKK
jgi:hypothetical protein